MQVGAVRYYFHIRLLGELLPDRDGIEMPDIAEARAEAERIAWDLGDDLILNIDNVGTSAVEVTDPANKLLFIVVMRGLADRAST